MSDATFGSIVGPRSINGPSCRSINVSMKSWLPQIAPAMMSDMPLMNFVMLCTTMSAPSAAGLRISGVNVLSTTSGMPALLATAASFGMSATRNVGLAMLSV